MIKQTQSHDAYNLTQVNFHIIDREIRILVGFSISDFNLELTVDSGASVSLLRPHKLYSETQISNRDKITIVGISNQSEITTIGRTFPEMLINNCLYSHPFHVVDEDINLNSDGILGNDFLMKYGASISYSDSTMRFYLPSSEIPYVRNPTFNRSKREDIERNDQISNDKDVQTESKNSLENMHEDQLPIDTDSTRDKGTVSTVEETMRGQVGDFFDDSHVRALCHIDVPREKIQNMHSTGSHNISRSESIFRLLNLSHCSPDEEHEMSRLCNRFNEVFYLEGDPLKHTDVIQHEIELKPGTTPIFTRQYRIPESQKEEIQKQLDDLESRGIIEKSNSPWNSPLLLVPKKDNEKGEKRFRLVIDYRRLNGVTQPLSYPIPLVDEIIDQMQGAQIFTTLDLQGAFHQIRMHPRCKQYTAFSTSWCKYQFNSCPFGLLGSPYTWLRAIHTVLKGIIGLWIGYMDDIIIYSTTLREHMKILESVVKRLIQHNLKLNIEKSMFLRSHVSYLGHIISKDGIKMDPKKTECVSKFPRPNSVVETQRFLGMTNYRP